MTRTYGAIKEVYIAGQGWVVYNSQPLNTMEMLNVEYDVYNEDGELISTGTEDFSWERWVRLQGININATTAMETLQILTDSEIDEMLTKYYNNLNTNTNTLKINTVEEVTDMYRQQKGYIWEICYTGGMIVNSLTSDHCTGLEVVKLAEYLYRISFSTYNRHFNYTIDTLNEKQGDLRTRYYKNRLKNIY